MSKAQGAGNVVAERVVVEDGHFVLFDQLPPVVRKELANAPYSMAVEKILETVNEARAAGMDDFQIADVILFRFRNYLRDKVRQECQRLYGPEHPQAGPR